MNILLEGNDVTYSGIELVVYTLLTHNSHCNIYVATMDMELNRGNGLIQIFKSYTPEQRERLTKLVKYLDPTSHICFLEVYDIYKKYLIPSVNELTPFTPYAALRLASDIMLPNLDEVLYLDADVAINGNIEGVYNDYAKRDGDYSAFIFQDACGYEGEMISGIILFNLKKIRETGFLERARANYRKNEYEFPDQSALKDAGKPLQFPDYFGCCTKLEERTELPLIVHFTNELAPKIYFVNDKQITFYRKFPWLQYVKDGLKIFDSIQR